ncbi:MAG: DUF1491 family protein [Pseudomonadota bacterium]
MTRPRLKPHIRVAAHRRRCEAGGAFAHIARKGDPDAGAVAVKVYVGARRARLFVQSRDLDGASVWREPLADADDPCADEPAIDAWLARETDVDPDLWIVEIDDPKGRPFLDEND